MAKYASCSRAHCSQKGTPQISTTAWRGQGWSVLLPTWHCPSFFVASVFSKSFTTTVRILGVENAGAARSTTPNDAAGTDSLRHLLSRSSLGDCCFYYNYSTLLLLRLLSAILGGATRLPRKGLEPLLKDPSPYKVATSLPSLLFYAPWHPSRPPSHSRHSKRRWSRENPYRPQQTPVRYPERDSDLLLFSFGPLQPFLAKPLRGRYAPPRLLVLLADCPLRRCAPLSSL